MQARRCGRVARRSGEVGGEHRVVFSFTRSGPAFGCEPFGCELRVERLRIERLRVKDCASLVSKRLLMHFDSLLV
jgi:hypothetical protein